MSRLVGFAVSIGIRVFFIDKIYFKSYCGTFLDYNRKMCCMKKVSFYLDRFVEWKQGFPHHQLFISIIGFILFLIFGSNLYAAYLEYYITGYNNFKNRLFLKQRQYKRFFGNYH